MRRFLILIPILLILSIELFAQDKIVGSYRDYFGSSIQLNTNNTFRYRWHFDMVSSWTEGTWALIGDTVYFHMVPTYDTLSRSDINGIGFDTLILSTDEIPERFTQTQFAAMLLSSTEQNRWDYPDKLLFKKERLYKMRNGKRVVKKQKGFWSDKKWDPWFFKNDE
jgi:hypothetical protein